MIGSSQSREKTERLASARNAHMRAVVMTFFIVSVSATLQGI
jgi:hypothetical protein